VDGSSFWLRIFSSARLEEAQRVRRILAPPGPDGGRLRQVFIRRGSGAGGTSLFEVVSGPFEASMDAVLEGLRLRGDRRFALEGVRLDRLAVLLPTSFVALPLRFGPAELERLNPGGKKPYPVAGELLVARGMAFGQPSSTLPSIEHASAWIDHFMPLLLLGEREVCARPGHPCLRWFEALHPTLIQTIWIPSNIAVRKNDMKSLELAEGQGRTKARGALWPIGRSSSGALYGLVFRRGALPPQRFTVILPDRQGPPFRLVADRHGPGIYNSEGKVVHRISLGPWIYKRPPLWQLPEHLKGQLRRQAARRSRTSRPAALQAPPAMVGRRPGSP
jgi:hypothetical protein